jgi:antitoxin component YwqK of YwqJK toxin-antitoxin module
MSKDITPNNNKCQRHGLWEVYSYKGNLRFKCFFNNGKPVGYAENYYSHNDKLTMKKYHL